MHEVANAVVQHAQQSGLQEIADGFDTAEIIVGDDVYRRHEEGTVVYHGLSGPMEVTRWSYRQVGVHNGPTLVPLDRTAGLIERATPGLANAAHEGDRRHAQP